MTNHTFLDDSIYLQSKSVNIVIRISLILAIGITSTLSIRVENIEDKMCQLK